MTVQATASRTAAVHPAVRDAAAGLTVAAAAFGFAEILLQRIAAPVSAHVALPGAGALRSGGEFATGATAALVVAASAAAAVALRRPVLAAGLAATLLALAEPGTRVLLYAVVAAGLAVVVLHPHARAGGPTSRRDGAVRTLAPPSSRALRARPSSPASGGRTALVAAGAAVAAGLWPLVFAAGVTEARTVAEVALVAAPILAAIWVVRSRHVGAGAWLAAAALGGLAALALTVRLETTAMAAVWAVGVTLALPPVAYVAAAAAAGLVLAAWAAGPACRLRLAGAALLAVAGLQPAAVHHSLTALLAVVLLSLPAGALDEGAAP